MKTAVLIQAHSNVEHFINLFNKNKNVNFYIHIDKKNKAINEKVKAWVFDNVFIVIEPVNVYWGGYSQLLATLSLIKLAHNDPENNYFHLISGECVPLINFKMMEEEWRRDGNGLYLESRIRSEVDWRLNIKSPHSDTPLLRTFIGRVFNRFLKFLGNRIKFTKFNKEDYAFGSQWFSFTRHHASLILENESDKYFYDYKKIACADEHAFQMLFKKLKEKSTSNKRYILFNDGKSSPEYLEFPDLINARDNGFWFARKVKGNVFEEYVKYEI